MTLNEVKTFSDFSTVYEAYNLHGVGEKISFLRKALKIRASRSDIEDTPEGELRELEELVLTHLWEGLQK